MERKKASDFPQELLNLFDRYVHGGMSRREFLDGAQKFAVGGLTATALFEMLKPNYAWANQVPKDDSGSRRRSPRCRRRRATERSRAISCGRRMRPESCPPSWSSTRTAVSIRTSKTWRGAWRSPNFMAFAPDGLTSVGGYPGDDEKGVELFRKVDAAKMTRRFRRRGGVAEVAPGQHRQARRRRLLLRRRHRQSARGADGIGPRRRRPVLRSPAQGRGRRQDQGAAAMRNTASSTPASRQAGRLSMPR